MRETHRNGLIASKPFARNKEFHCMMATKFRHTNHTNHRRNDANTNFREAEQGVGICDDNVGRANETQPAGKCSTIYGCDHGFGACQDRF